jgi:hypothetical protein
MDMHVFFADQSIRSLDGLTAFSALPDAPVLPVKHRRRPLRALRSSFRRRPVTHPVYQPAPATIAGNPCA